MKYVVKKDKQKNIIKKQNGSGGNDTEDNLIEVCRKCHRLIHDGKIKINKG